MTGSSMKLRAFFLCLLIVSTVLAANVWAANLQAANLQAANAQTATPPALAERIVATHYTGDTFAPDMWGSLSPAAIPSQLAAIRANGFNAVIVPVPWTGFQYEVDPPAYTQVYFDLLQDILRDAQALGLRVILRLGYHHEGSVSSTPGKGYRSLAIFANPALQKAWREYLEKTRLLVADEPAFLFAFISWEDFFLPGAMLAGEDARLAMARETGYQTWLAGRPMDEIAEAYGQSFASAGEAPIPAQGSRAARLFHAYYDAALLKLLKSSREVFPGLNLEARVDCDPAEGGAVCHDATFDLGGLDGTTLIYYTPAWGAPNVSDRATAREAAARLRRLLETVRAKTDKPIFVDQFNFVDNTPGFSHNTTIEPAEIPAFLNLAGPILREHCAGFALWTMRDVPGSFLKNSSFERGDQHWELNQAAIETTAKGTRALRLPTGGSAAQTLTLSDGDAHVSEELARALRLTLRLELLHADVEKRGPAQLRVEITDERGASVFRRLVSLNKGPARVVELRDIPWFAGGELRLSNLGPELLLDQAQLYVMTQHNGVYDLDGAPRPFRDAFLELGQRFLQPPAPLPWLDAQAVREAGWAGVFPDGWVGPEASIKLRLAPDWPTDLMLEAYVPEDWTDRENSLSILSGETLLARCHLAPGLNLCAFRAPEPPRDAQAELQDAARVPPLTLRCDRGFMSPRFAPDNQDIRELAFVLSGVGLRRARPDAAAPASEQGTADAQP